MYKILTSLILKRLKTYTEVQIGEYQHGFGKGKSMNDAIHMLDHIIEKCYNITMKQTYNL